MKIWDEPGMSKLNKDISSSLSDSLACSVSVVLDIFFIPST